MVHSVSPYDPIGKNLGFAYNEAFKNCSEDDWLCLTDWDVVFLTPDALAILNQYANTYPNTGIFTCWTNRIHPGATQQLRPGLYEEMDLLTHIRVAEQCKDVGLSVTELKKHISGFLMMISKKTWNEIKFNEDGKCLGVDNEYSDRILQARRKILRMDSIYVLHLYRMGMAGGIKDKSHLL